jgi:hypothetical protein
MSRTFIRQAVQIAPSDYAATPSGYDDTVTPSLANYESTRPANLEDDLNSLRSSVQNILNRNGATFPSGDWFSDMTQPTTLENGSKRGVDAVNAALHLVEKKRILRDKYRPGNDVVVTAAQNWEVLALGELPTNAVAAVGSVTTLGTVVAFHAGTFDTHSLDEVSGTNTLNPKNLCIVTDATTGDPILSSGRTIYALLQSETVTDGHTMTGTTPNRAQLSFVRPNATFDDLEACAVVDIAGKTINYASRERVRLEDLNEQDFLKGAVVDVPAGSTPTRQTVYDNQGVTPVDLTTNALLDLEGAGLTWQVRDDLQAILFQIIEGSAGGTSSVQIAGDTDTFNVNAVLNDFLNGVSVDTGAAGTTINIGVTANQIDSGGAITVATGGAGDLKLDSVGGEVLFDDVNRTGSTWSATSVKLSDTTTEWDNYETQFGEVSIFNALVQASTKAARVKGYATVTANVPVDTDVALTTAGNLDANLPDYSRVGLVFVDDCDVYLNGELLRNGANAAANHDVYPGTTPSVGMLKFEFALRGTGSKPDQLCMVVWGS